MVPFLTSFSAAGLLNYLGIREMTNCAFRCLVNHLFAISAGSGELDVWMDRRVVNEPIANIVKL